MTSYEYSKKIAFQTENLTISGLQEQLKIGYATAQKYMKWLKSEQGTALLLQQPLN